MMNKEVIPLEELEVIKKVALYYKCSPSERKDKINKPLFGELYTDYPELFIDIEDSLKALEIIKPLVYIFWNMGGYGEIRLNESGKRIKQYIPKNEYELLRNAGFKEVLL